MRGGVKPPPTPLTKTNTVYKQTIMQMSVYATGLWMVIIN